MQYFFSFDRKNKFYGLELGAIDPIGMCFLNVPFSTINYDDPWLGWKSSEWYYHIEFNPSEGLFIDMFARLQKFLNVKLAISIIFCSLILTFEVER